MTVEFEVRKSTKPAQPYYWHVKSRGNGKILASSETYVNKKDCVDAIKQVKSGASAATIWDMTGDTPRIIS